MAIKTSALLFLTISLFSFSVLSNATEGSNTPAPRFQKLGVAKAHPIKIDQTDIDQGSEEMAKVIQNSSPEIKAALLKAAKELEEKKKTASEDTDESASGN